LVFEKLAEAFGVRKATFAFFRVFFYAFIIVVFKKAKEVFRTPNASRILQAPLCELMDIKILLTLAACFGLALFSYFLPGDLLELDAHSHLGRTWLFKDILVNEHVFPIWTNRWYFGYPIGLYYGFLYYLLSALFTIAAFGNVVLGTKIFLWLTHVLSGLAMFVFIRHLTRSISAAIFTSIFYVFSPQHLGTLLQEGRFPLSLIFLLLPIIFYVFEKCDASKKPIIKNAPLMSALLALALFTHLQFGFYCFLSFFLTAFSRILLAPKDSLQRTKFLFATGLFFALFTAWILIPAIQDAPFLVQNQNDSIRALGGTSFHLEKIKLMLTEVLWSDNHSRGHAYYFGLIPLSMLLFSWKQQRYSVVYLSYLTALFIGLGFLLKTPRFIYMEFFFICIFSSYGWIALQASLPSFKRALPTVFILLTAIDLGPQLRLTPYKKIKNEKTKEAQKIMNETGESGRFLSLRKTKGTLWASLDVIDTYASTPFGGIPQNATKPYPYAAAIASQAAKEIYDDNKNLSEATYKALRLFNIKTLWIPEKRKFLTISNNDPIWFAPKIEQFKGQESPLEQESWMLIRLKFEDRTLDSPSVNRYIAAMGMHTESNILDQVLSHDPIVAPKALDSHDSKFLVHHFQETHHKVSLDYESNSDGFAWLSYAYFPHNKIKIDGMPIDFYRSVMNFIIIPIKEGKHSLTLTAELSVLRKSLLWTACAAFLLSVVIWIKHET